jgi:hypothetical protein
MRSRRFWNPLFAALACYIFVVIDVTAQPLPYLYWVETSATTSSIKRAVVGDTAIVTLVSGLENLRGFDVDPVAGTLYWTLNEEVVRLGLGEAHSDTIMTDVRCGIPDRLGGIRLDLRARKLYVMRYSDCMEPFMRANLDGSDPETVPISSNGMSSNSFVIDSTASKFYWTFKVNSHNMGILRANLDGTEWEVIVPEVSATAFVLNPEAGHVYWTEFDTGTIRRANLDGTDVEDVLVNLSGPLSIAVETLEGMLYWTEYGSGAIHRATLDGRNAEEVISGLSRPGGIRIGYATGTSIEGGSAPEPSGGFMLEQNHPNPFRMATTIEYVLDQAQHVRLAVYDLLGQELAVLVNSMLPSGRYEVRFDASGLPSGVYFYKMQAGDFIQTRQMVLLK